jgi:hypothetical protein
MALALKAAAVWVPVTGGLTARTMPEVQSLFAEEKNQSGWVSLTCESRQG